MSENNKKNLNFGRIKYYDPNEFFGGDNQPVNQEDLTKYVNLSVKIPSRYYHSENFKKYDSIFKGTEFIGKKNDDKEYTVLYLTDNYVNVSYNEFRPGGKISAGELFGIDSIDISFDVQFFPQVTINFTDVKGFGLMSTMECNYENDNIKNLTAKSFFTSLFNFPYPIFTLEVKGYYGKSVSFDLSLLEFHTAFDSQNGNFKTTVKFVGHMYGVYADIPMSYLMVSPYIDYRGKLDDVNYTEDPVGPVWRNIGGSIPTYLSFLKKYNEFLLQANSQENNGFSVVNTFVSNQERINKLESIKTQLGKIVTESEMSRSELNGDISISRNNVVYVCQIITESSCVLENILEPYKTLKELIDNNISYEEYIPSVEEKSENGYKLWKFTNINTLITKCEREINILKTSNDSNRNVVNQNLKTFVEQKIGMIPNIKNVYKMIFKHLNCFSNHFFTTLETISESNRTLTSTNLINYETDVPLLTENDNYVPPFPAVYITSKGERTIVYPGDIDTFKTEPEVKLTESIFNSINYFGQTAVDTLTELEQNRQEVSETIVTKNGTFFIDGLEELNGERLDENLKHYSIIRPSNTSFDNYEFSLENVTANRYDDSGGVARNAKRSETIQDIFLSRLALFERLHYMEGSDSIEHNSEHFINTESTLLCSIYPSMVENNELVNALRKMRNSNNSGSTITRYTQLSGGTNNDHLWGFINYKPDIEKDMTSDRIESLAKEGIIHYNGYSGSTIIVYNSGLTFNEAESKFNGIDFHNNYKLKSDAKYNKGIEELLDLTELYFYTSTNEDRLYRTYTKRNWLDENENPSGTESLKYGKTYRLPEDTDFRTKAVNYGGYKANVIGDEPTRRFLFKKYKVYTCETKENTFYDNECELPTNGTSTFTMEYDTKSIIPNVKEMNKICLINNVCFKVLEEWREKEIDYKNESNRIYKLKPLYPAEVFNENSTFNWGFTNKLIGIEKYDECLDSLQEKIKSETTNYDDDDVFLEKYCIFAKNVQYDRSNYENKLTNDKIWKIWQDFVCKVLEKFGLECEPTSNTRQRDIDRKEADKKIKTDIYYTLKSLYDKWYSGLNRKYFELKDEECEYNKIHYLTTTFNDISDTMIVDLESLVNQVSDAAVSTDGSAHSVISFMAKTAQDNNSTFLALPMKLQWGATEESINEIFKPYNFYDGTATHDPYGTSYVVMYNGDVSHHLDIDKSEYVNDGYDIANYFDGEMKATPEAIALFVQEENSYEVPAFGVTYGMQNQNFFKNISVNTTNPSVTDYSIANTLVISQNGSLAGATNSIPSIKSLYPIYANRSYTCNVEMMGCMYITPLLYFQLNNVPMFRGAYIITNVHHRITPNDFITTFSGVRVSKYKIPINTEVISLTSLLRTRNITNNNGGTQQEGQNGGTQQGGQNGGTQQGGQNGGNAHKLPGVSIGIENDTLNLDKNGQYFLGYTYSANTGYCLAKSDCDNSARSTLKNLTTALGFSINGCGAEGGSANRTIRLVTEKHKKTSNGLIIPDKDDNNLYYYPSKKSSNPSENLSMKDKYRETIELIKQHLYRGYPIRVAVNHTYDRPKGLINEMTSDHFVTIYAHGVSVTDGTKNTNLNSLLPEKFRKDHEIVLYNDNKPNRGKVEYFRFYESGTKHRNIGVNSKNVFIYVDDENPLFFCPDDRLNRILDVAMVFPYPDSIVNSSTLLSFDLVNYTIPPYWPEGELTQVPVANYKNYRL